MPRPRLRRLLGPGGSGGRWRGPEGPRVATECPGGSPLPAPAAAAAPDAQAGSVRERHARGSSLVPGAGRALAGRRAPEPGEERAPPGPRAPSSGAAGSGPGAVPGADDSAARGARIRDLPPTRGRPAPPHPGPAGFGCSSPAFPGAPGSAALGIWRQAGVVAAYPQGDLGASPSLGEFLVLILKWPSAEPVRLF